MAEIKFKLLNKNAKLPDFAYEGDAGFDIYSAEEATLLPGESHVFMTGISSEIPDDYFVSIRGKSGLGIKHGINSMAGVIDAGYRGEWRVMLINHGKDSYTFKIGDKLAQGVLHKIQKTKIIQTDDLSTATDRGEKGIGSSGK